MTWNDPQLSELCKEIVMAMAVTLLFLLYLSADFGGKRFTLMSIGLYQSFPGI